MDINGVLQRLMQATARNQILTIPVQDEEAPGTDYAYASVKLREVISWHLDGFVDPGAAAALWAEIEGP